MGKIHLVIHGSINHFLAPMWKNSIIEYTFNGKVSIKHILESLGIPHPEVGVIKNGEKSYGLNYHVKDQDTLDVYPFDPRANRTNPEDIRFILDNHLGKLCDYLRLLGFDVLYDPNWEDQAIAEMASHTRRILLSRDRGLLKRKLIMAGYCVRADKPRDQVDEVLQHFGLEKEAKPFQRCPRCNGLLQRVEKEEILDQLQPLTRKYYDEFMRCPDCSQIYWKGSHYERMQKFISKYRPKGTPEG